MKNEKKSEMSSKMYSNHRCGKCNRFGHHHDKCTKLEKTLDSFIAKNKGAGKQTSRLTPKWKEFDSIHKTKAQSKAYDRVMDNVDTSKWQNY